MNSYAISGSAFMPDRTRTVLAESIEEAIEKYKKERSRLKQKTDVISVRLLAEDVCM
jgi:hypothetical protein